MYFPFLQDMLISHIHLHLEKLDTDCDTRKQTETLIYTHEFQKGSHRSIWAEKKLFVLHEKSTIISVTLIYFITKRYIYFV